MKDEIRDQRWLFRGALPVSLILHSLIAALLIFGLPVSLSQPEKEEAISVDLVPPPEPIEKAKTAPPPPAAKPKLEEPQANAENPPASNEPVPPPPALRPVSQFGEKDAGPKEALDGNGAEEGSTSGMTPNDLDKQAITEPPAMPAVDPMNQAPQPGAPETLASKSKDADPIVDQAPQPETPKTQASKSKGVAEVQSPVKLQKAKKLFSQAATGDPIATTAMGGLPRGARAGQLCVTELAQQLLNASPPYFPERLPFDRLHDGTVLEILNTAFRASGQWHNISYRCEVDADALKVVSFAFNVGNVVPRSEWKSRGLPSQ